MSVYVRLTRYFVDKFYYNLCFSPKSHPKCFSIFIRFFLIGVSFIADNVTIGFTSRRISQLVMARY